MATARLTYTENTPKTFNNEGRPLKGFNKRRQRIQEAEPLEFFDYLKSCFADYESEGGEVTLGTLTDGIWQEYVRGESWNTVRVQFPGKDAKFRRVESFQEEHEEYIEKFQTWQERILSGFY
jgi:hypothetical protein